MKCTSPILENMSGKLGGSVFAKARGGIQYVRALVTPTNPSTFLQTAMRNAVASASALWRNTLSELQQQEWWDLAGELGSGSTGKTLFAKVNQPRVYTTNAERLVNGTDGGTALTSLPPIFSPPDSMNVAITGLPAVTIDDSANSLAIGIPDTTDQWFNGVAEATPSVQYVYVSAGQKSSRFARQHPYELVAAIYYTDSADALASTINLAALGLPTVAGYVMYVKRYVQAPDGSISIPIEERITIVA